MQTERKQRKSAFYTFERQENYAHNFECPSSLRLHLGSKFCGSQVRVTSTALVVSFSCILSMNVWLLSSRKMHRSLEEWGQWTLKPTRRMSKSSVITTETQWLKCEQTDSGRNVPLCFRGYNKRLCASLQAAWLQTSQQFIFFLTLYTFSSTTGPEAQQRQREPWWGRDEREGEWSNNGHWIFSNTAKSTLLLSSAATTMPLKKSEVGTERRVSNLTPNQGTREALRHDITLWSSTFFLFCTSPSRFLVTLSPLCLCMATLASCTSCNLVDAVDAGETDHNNWCHMLFGGHAHC